MSASRGPVSEDGERLSYRERRLAKAEKLREWAEKRDLKSAERYKMATSRVEMIPLGQPILVGHHSERRHRAAIEQIDSNMAKSIENDEKAKRCVNGPTISSKPQAKRSTRMTRMP